MEVAAKPVLESTKPVSIGNSSASKILGTVISKSLAKADLWNSKPLKRSIPNSLQVLGVKVSRKSNDFSKDVTLQSAQLVTVGASSETKEASLSNPSKSLNCASNIGLPLVYYSDDSNDSDISNSDNT